MSCENSGFQDFRPYDLIGTFPQQATNFTVVNNDQCNSSTVLIFVCLFFQTKKQVWRNGVEADSCGACSLPLNFLYQGSDFGFSIPCTKGQITNLTFEIRMGSWLCPHTALEQ